MYEKFTDRARKVMQLANQEAQRFNHEYIGTEHLLLGLIKEGGGVAARVLEGLEIDHRKIRLEVEKLLQSGPGMVTMGKLPHTPRAKKVIEQAMEEARSLKHDYVGTEHLLLGLLREQEGIASQVLMALGLTVEAVRTQTLDLLGATLREEPSEESRPDLVITYMGIGTLSSTDTYRLRRAKESLAKGLDLALTTRKQGGHMAYAEAFGMLSAAVSAAIKDIDAFVGTAKE